ncbi:hypothetical protein S245_060974, partial [Arachis hypogaea]
ILIGEITLYVLVKFLLVGVPFIILLCIYKWRRRHLSVYPTIEDFLRSDNSIMPIRYSYKDIKNITGVQDKTGEWRLRFCLSRKTSK